MLLSPLGTRVARDSPHLALEVMRFLCQDLCAVLPVMEDGGGGQNALMTPHYPLQAQSGPITGRVCQTVCRSLRRRPPLRSLTLKSGNLKATGATLRNEKQQLMKSGTLC